MPTPLKQKGTAYDKNGHAIDKDGKLVFDSKCHGCDAPTPTQESGKSRDTDEFMRCFGVVKEWFRIEEIEVGDLTLGRMASRLKQHEHELLESYRKERAK